MQITTARPADIEEVWAFLDTAFGYQPYSFRDDIPWQWNQECIEWDNTFIIRDNMGRIASLVRLWELHLVQDERPVTCGGIGSVATAEHARGAGSMTALMNYAAHEMQRRGYPLAILAGDRFRYETFGYEFAGCTLNLEVETRGLKRREIEPIDPQTFDKGVLSRIEITRSQMPYYVQRRDCETKHIYQAKNCKVLAAGDDDFAFLVLDGGKIREWGGDVHTALRLSAFAAQENWAQSFTFALPYGVQVPDEMLHTISHWSIIPMCSAVIYDLDKTLDAFDAREYRAQLANLNSRDQVWHLFGKPDAPRNLWLSLVDMV